MKLNKSYNARSDWLSPRFITIKSQCKFATQYWYYPLFSLIIWSPCISSDDVTGLSALGALVWRGLVGGVRVALARKILGEGWGVVNSEEGLANFNWLVPLSGHKVGHCSCSYYFGVRG